MTTPGRPWWNGDVAKLVALRRLARNKLFRYPSLDNTIAYNKACALARRAIIKAKEKAWNDFLLSANHETSTKQMWKVFKAISGSNVSSSSFPITSDDGNPLDSKGIANKLAVHFSNVFNAPPHVLPPDSSTPTPCTDSLNSLFTIEELSLAISKLKVKSTHGVDNITNLFLKKMPSTHYPAILNIINKSWRKGEIPQEWKHAHIITFPKSGRDPALLKSYRPISILSCLGKTMERMIIS